MTPQLHHSIMLLNITSTSSANSTTFPPSPDPTQELLSLLTIITSSISLVGLVFAFITYTLFSDVRALAGTTLMNLLASLFLLQLLFVVGVGHEPVRDHRLCAGLAFIIHGIALSVFAWLAAMTRDLFVTSRNAPKTHGWTFCGYSTLAWGLPLAFTCLAISLRDLQTPGLWDRCRLMGPVKTTYGFCVPLVFVTLVMGFYAMRSAFAIGKAGTERLIDMKWIRKWQRAKCLMLVLYVKVYVGLLIVWVCGLVCSFSGASGFCVGFQVLFSVQGIFVAVAYACNRKVLRVYARYRAFRPKKGGYLYGGDLSRSGSSLKLLTWQPLPDAV